MNRAGTFDLGAAKTANPRFGGFIFSDAQAFVLEFTALAVRFWTPAGQVLNAGIPYELVTPYLAADLPALNFAQAGDVIRITHPSYQPRDLTRIGNTNWTLSLVSFGPPAGFFPTALALDANGWAGDNGTGWNNATFYTTGKYVIASNLSCYISIGQGTNQDPIVSPSAYWSLALDASHPVKAWTYLVTALWRDASGINYESLPSPAMPTTAAVYTDRPLSFHWTAPADPGFPYKLTGYSVYRGRNGTYGWIGDADGTATTFKDDGKVPDFGIRPPKGTNPFLVADGADSAATFHWPACSTFHEQRWAPATTSLKPDTFFGSQAGNINGFDVNDPPQDTEAYEWRISSRRLADIRHAVSFGRLVLFTGQGVYSARGPDGKSITPTSPPEVRKHSPTGSNFLPPLELEDVLLFCTARGNHIRDFFFDIARETFRGIDLSKGARHLFRGHTIVSWAHQEEPYHLVWIVRDDGLLLSLTYDRETETIAWAQHPTFGPVTQVQCIPNGTEDALFIATVINGSTRVQVMASRDYIPDVRFCCFLDAARQFDGRNAGATTMQVTGATYNADDIVTVAASVASFALTDIGDQQVIDPDGTPTRITVTGFTDAQHVTGRLEAPLPAAFQNVATAAWGWARDTLTGLDHLEGLEVMALVDGVVQGPFTVAGGQIATLNPPALIATAGLGYNSDAELLDVAADGKNNVKSVVQAKLEVVASRGMFAGEDFDHLRPAQTRQVSDNFGAPALITDQVEILTDSSWNRGGRAVVRQSDPLPLTITAVTRDVEFGGRS